MRRPNNRCLADGLQPIKEPKTICLSCTLRALYLSIQEPMEQPDAHELDYWNASTPDLSLALIDRSTEATPPGSVRKNPAGLHTTSRSGLSQNARPLGALFLIYGINLVLAILYLPFINYVLIQGSVQVGRVFFNASTTNLLVSIFSQISAALSHMMVRSLLSALRLAFANRKDGISALTFLGLGPAAGWLQVLRLAFIDRLFNLWCDFRYVLEYLIVIN